MESDTGPRPTGQDSTQPNGIYPAVIPADQFLANKPPPPAPLILQVISRGSKLAIGGGSKSYKTWILMDLALSVSTGTQWLGFQSFKSRVLYVNFEIPPYFFHERLTMIAQAKGATVPPEFLLWNLRGVRADAVTSLQPMILKTATDQKADFTIIDPLYKYGGGIDENSTTEITKLFNAIDEVTAKSGAAVCYGGHFSKGNQAAKNPIDRISGSGIHGRDPDAIINFTAHKEKDAFTVDFTLRYMPPVASFVVRWKCPLFEVDTSLDPKDLLREQKQKSTLTLDQLLFLLKAEQRIENTPRFYELAKKMLKAGRSTFYKLIKSLPVCPGVRHDAKTDEWRFDPVPGN